MSCSFHIMRKRKAALRAAQAKPDKAIDTAPKAAAKTPKSRKRGGE